jgi:hypothetical protein
VAHQIAIDRIAGVVLIGVGAVDLASTWPSLGLRGS